MSDEEIRNVLSRFMNSFGLKDWTTMTGLLEPTIAIDYADLRGELNTHAFYTFSVVPSGTTWRISAIEQRVL